MHWLNQLFISKASLCSSLSVASLGDERGAPPPHPNHLPSGSSPRPPPLQAVARRRRPALVPKPASMLFHPSPLSIFFSHFRFVLQVVVTPMAMAACYGGGSGASECGSGPYGTGSGAPRRGGVAARAGRCISHHGCCLCCFAPCRSREPKGLKQQGAIYSGGYRGGLVPGAAMLGDDGGRGRNPTPVPAPWTLWSPAARVPSTAAVARASRHASAMDLAPCGMWLPVISRRVLQLVGRYTPGEIPVRYFTGADNDDTMRCRSPFLKALFEASLPLSICWLGMGTGQEKS